MFVGRNIGSRYKCGSGLMVLLYVLGGTNKRGRYAAIIGADLLQNNTH